MCPPPPISNRTLPTISDTGSAPTYDTHTLTTTSGAWNVCNDTISYYIYDWLRNNTIVQSVTGPAPGSGSSPPNAQYLLTGADIAQKIQSEVFACDATDYCVGATSSNYIVPGAKPSGPANSSSVPTTTPALSADNATNGAYYLFFLTSDSGCTNVLASSGWVPSTNTWSVPAGLLNDGGLYYWCVQAENAGGTLFSAWSTTQSFTVQLPQLGSQSDWPMWSHGPVSVNESNGNLVLSLPTPSYPTATGSLTFSLTYNSEAPSSWEGTTPGLANGWTLTAGDAAMSRPLRLIDHNLAAPTSASVEIVWPDGNSDFYTQVGTTGSHVGVTYLASSDNGSALTENPDGTWTLVDSDGTSYSFGAESSGGIAPLTGATSPASSSGSAVLSYAAFDSQGRITALTYKQASGDSGGESLNFSWGVTCDGVTSELCVTFENNGAPIPGQTWAYVGSGGPTGSITQVYDPRWQVMQLAYTSGQVTAIQNANDLHSAYASPGYDSQHALTISYDSHSPVRVSTVSETQVTNQTPSSTSTWSFAYHPGSIQAAAPRASHYGYLVRNDAPAAYYPLDETSGTTATDVSGNGNRATYAGSYTLGQTSALAGTGSGTSVAFSGGTVAGSVSTLDLSPGRLNTVEFWVKWNGTASVMPFSFSNYSALWFDNGDFGFNTGCGDIYGTVAPSANTWHYIVAEFYNGYPRDGAKLWVDGVQQPLTQKFGTPCSRTVGANFAISGDPTDGNYRMGGSIDEVAIYGYPLSPDQISAHYNEAIHSNRMAAGYTTLTPPDQQGQVCPSDCVTTYYDSVGRSIETVDTLGRTTESAYNSENELLWSEDADGNPTDYLYGGPNGLPSVDPNVAPVLLQTVSPDPDGSGPMARPVATYRYDEQTIGTQRQAGIPLSGLSGTYWTNQNVSGTPAVRETDPTPGSGATSFSLPVVYNGWPVSGYTSARWTGDVNVPSSGDYTLSTVSDGGTRLSLDNVNAIDNWAIPTSSSKTVSSSTIYLSAGLHPLVIDYEHAPRTVGGVSVLPSFALDWSCSDCGQTIPSLTPVPVGDLAPAYDNQTSVTSPAGRLSFQHYSNPVSGQPDYSAVSSGGFPSVSASGGGGGAGAGNCVGGVGGGGGAGSSGIDISASYHGGSGGTGYVYCQLGADTGGGGGSSAGTSANGNNGLTGVFRTNGDVALGGPAPTGGGAGGGSQWQPGDGGYPGGSPGGGGGASGAATTSTGCATYYTAGAGADGKAIITPNLGSPTTYTSAGNYTYSVAPGVTSLTVELWGAGGGGGRGYAVTGGAGASGGGGGGGGAYTKTTAITVAAGQTLSVTVGAGGAAGANGGGSGCVGSPNGPASAGSAGGTSTVRDSSPLLITSYVYDSLGRMVKQYMPKANASATLDPSTGNLSSTPDTNYETDYTYYGDGTTAGPPSDCPAGTAVDQYGQLESTTQYTSAQTGGVHSTSTVYNNLGLPIAQTNGKGDSCLGYDGYGEGLLTSQTPYGDTTNPADTINYTHDPSGAVLKTEQGTSGPAVTNTYDEVGRLIDTVDASGAEAHYAYDADGNTVSRVANTHALSGTTCPSATDYCTTYAYDTADELSSETDPASNTYSFYYDNRGNLRGTKYPNGTFSWVDTNPDGWISDQYNRHGTISASTTPATVPSDSCPLADFTYTYDADGKRLSEARQSGSTSQTTTYSYDNVGRLSQTLLPSGTCRDYSYDLDSNRSVIKESSSGCSGSFSTSATYNYTPATTPGIDQLTSIAAGGTTNYTYTSDGQVSNQGTTIYGWDGFGRLSTAQVGSNTVTYSYDPTGALKSRASSSPTATTNYLLGDLFETNGGNTITTSYTDGPAGDLASFSGPPTGTPTYLYYDAHGNLAAEADNTGAQTGNHTYDPFGGPLDTPPANTTAHRFTGRWDKQYDTTTGLVLMGARPYDPITGRFLAVDPVAGGSLNNYDYAGQDPINNYDLNGTCVEGFGWFCSAMHSVWSALKEGAPVVLPIAAAAVVLTLCPECAVGAAIAAGGVSFSLHVAEGQSASESALIGTIDGVTQGTGSLAEAVGRKMADRILVGLYEGNLSDKVVEYLLVKDLARDRSWSRLAHNHPGGW